MQNLLVCAFALLFINPIFSQTGQVYPTCEEAGEHPIFTKDELENQTFRLLDYFNSAGPSPLCFNNGNGAANNISWISFIAGEEAEDFDIELILSNCIIDQGIQWGIVANCDFETVICDGSCTDATAINIITDNIIPCHQYWIWIDGCNGDVCDFNFVVHNGFTNNVSYNGDNCDDICPQPIFPDTDLNGGTDFNCLDGSMIAATPETLFSECGFDTIPTVWFKVYTDADAADIIANVSLQGNDVWDPVFAIYQGNCPSLEPLSSDNKPHCNIDWINPMTIDQPVETLSVYWIAVGASGDENDINNNPNFELCVATRINLISCLGNTNCEQEGEWELIASDLDSSKVGIINLEDPPELCPGETIDLCFEFLYDGSGTGADGLGGIVPFFGTGWDQSVFDPADGFVIGAEQFANWYEEGVPILQEDLQHLCTYTDSYGNLQVCNVICRTCPCTPGLVEGSPLPGGWFWVSEGSGIGCENDGTPGEGFGIGFVTASVDVCVSLTVRNDFMDATDCENADLLFGIQTFSDGVAGCWEDPVAECVLDIDQFIRFNIKCEDEIFYEDKDLDGFGDDLVTINACIAPEGYVSISGDCDDNNSSIYPGATEICDMLDNDCNGITDDNLVFLDYYADEDVDGFGNPDEVVNDCNQPAGYVLNNSDCDDTNADINPNAPEICDNNDNNCNSQIDEGLIYNDYYLDNDMDGFGDPDVFINDCIQPAGYVLDNNDCDDSNADINPDASEICDDIDNNCNGEINEGLTTTDYYIDNDMDGFGDPNVIISDCSQPEGYVLNNTDCDDANSNINPDADDIPSNGIDEDCDGMDMISGIHEVNGITFKLFPNPTADVVNISMTRQIDFEVSIYNIQGVKLLTSYTNQIDLSHFTNGIYILCLTTNEESNPIIERIVLSK